jgi:hypothetical protein
MKRVLQILSLCIFIFLSACSSEPSKDEVSKAVRDFFAAEVNNALKSKFLGVDFISAMGFESISVDQVEKVSCTPEGKNASQCEVVIQISLKTKEDSLLKLFAGDSQKKSVQKFRFVKISSGWMVAD